MARIGFFFFALGVSLSEITGKGVGGGVAGILIDVADQGCLL